MAGVCGKAVLSSQANGFRGGMSAQKFDRPTRGGMRRRSRRRRVLAKGKPFPAPHARRFWARCGPCTQGLFTPTEFHAAFRLASIPGPGFAPVPDHAPTRSTALPSVDLRGVDTRQARTRDPCGLSRRRPPLPRSARRAEPAPNLHIGCRYGEQPHRRTCSCRPLPGRNANADPRPRWNGAQPRPRIRDVGTYREQKPRSQAATASFLNPVWLNPRITQARGRAVADTQLKCNACVSPR
jgi:hypothetical protein